MPKFSPESEAKLNTCDPRLIEIMRTVIQFIDCKIACGYRGEAEQNKAFADGRSKVKYPNGMHNTTPAKAVDVLPYPLDWKDEHSFIYLAGHIMMTAHLLGYKIRWGHDWNRNNSMKDEKFVDMPHYEIVE